MLFYLENRFFYKLARVYEIFGMYKFILINVHTLISYFYYIVVNRQICNIMQYDASAIHKFTIPTKWKLKRYLNAYKQ